MTEKVEVDRNEYTQLHEALSLKGHQVEQLIQEKEKLQCHLDESRGREGRLMILLNAMETYRVSIFDQLTVDLQRSAPGRIINNMRRDRVSGSVELDVKGEDQRICVECQHIVCVCGRTDHDVRGCRYCTGEKLCPGCYRSPCRCDEVKLNRCEHCSKVYRYYCDCQDDQEVPPVLEATHESFCIGCGKTLTEMGFCSDCKRSFADLEKVSRVDHAPRVNQTGEVVCLVCETNVPKNLKSVCYSCIIGAQTRVLSVVDFICGMCGVEIPMTGSLAYQHPTRETLETAKWLEKDLDAKPRDFLFNG